MLARTLFTTTLFALASLTAATPPGCLLGAVNTYDDPSDIKAVCSSKDATQTIQRFCGDATKDALSAFADICNGAGVKVSTDVPTSSGSGSATGTASGSPTGTASGSASSTGTLVVRPSGSGSLPSATGLPVASSAGGGGASATTTGAGLQSTGAAGRMEVGAAAALLGLFAIVL